MAIAARKNHAGGRMWPSLETATQVSALANWALVVSLGVGVVATLLIVWMSSVKESYWDEDRRSSRERVAGLDVAVADANARAAEANRMAEADRLARVKIESGLASRRLTSEQGSKLTATLALMRGRVPSINLMLLGDKEANDFGSDLLQAIRAAGIQVNISLTGMASPPSYGLHVVDTPDGALRAAFGAAGIAQVRYAASGSPTPNIFVGLKPPAF